MTRKPKGSGVRASCSGATGGEDGGGGGGCGTTKVSTASSADTLYEARVARSSSSSTPLQVRVCASTGWACVGMYMCMYRGHAHVLCGHVHVLCGRVD